MPWLPWLPWLIGFGVLGLLLVLSLVRAVHRAGPPTVGASVLAAGRSLARWTAEAPGEGWQELGSRTDARGLDLFFDHDDDPQAEATLLAPSADRSRTRGSLARPVTVRLQSAFATHHAHTAGLVFRVTLRGTGSVVGKEIRLSMVVGSDGRPVGGRIENDDDTDAAVGGWIEVREAEILRVERRRAA